MSLKQYKQKRNFKNTPEPVSGRKKLKPLSFVVQRHDASHLHYDFRLEMKGVFKSWAVPKGPSMVAGEKRLAVMVEDHPYDYGKFYGEIPEGNYGAGTVDIWDYGTYKPLVTSEKKEDAELLSELKKGDLKFVLKGHYLKGAFALVRMKGDDEKNWLLIKKADDEAAKSFSIEKYKPLRTKKKGRSKVVKKPVVASRKKKVLKQGFSSEKDIETAWARLNRPMLARLSCEVRNDKEWIYEMKYDGYRCMTKISRRTVEMLSRNGKSFNKAYAPLAMEMQKVGSDVILDGEVVIEDKKGVSNFQLLQNYITTKEGELKYYVFDLLYLDGHDVSGLPLKERKELLSSFFKIYKFEQVLEAPVVEEKGKELFRGLKAKGYEGIIAKRGNSIYIPGRRSEDWLKIKSIKMQEAVICGYTLPKNSRQHFGSLLLGMYDNGELIYTGNCGTGFSEASLTGLMEDFSGIITKKCPFKAVPSLVGNKGKPVWLKPRLVCNVKFQEWTADQRMRVPVFMGLRTDKKATGVVKEDTMIKEFKQNKEDRKPGDNILTIGRKKVKVTNLSKEYWPGEGITKGDLINYYRTISTYILPYLKDRPLSLNRHPNGIKGPGFYQKDMDVKNLPSWAQTVRLYSKSNKAYIDYFLCNDEASLIYMANLGCIEVNPWHSLKTKTEYPSYLILDLDPGKIGFKAVVDTALAVKKICDSADITSFCKTSGATGLHIYIPLAEKYHDDDVKIFAELLAVLTHNALPSVTSIERLTSKRKNKVYVDFLQNRKGQTVAAAYSVRPRPGATVSAPLKWEEVNYNLSPQMFTIHNMYQRIKKNGDLWKGVLGKGCDIRKAIKKLSASAGN